MLNFLYFLLIYIHTPLTESSLLLFLYVLKSNPPNISIHFNFFFDNIFNRNSQTLFCLKYFKHGNQCPELEYILYNISLLASSN
jgi:hypothetical protein